MEIKIKEWTLDENKKYIMCVATTKELSIKDRVNLMRVIAEDLNRKNFDNGNIYYFPFDIALEPLCVGEEFFFDGEKFVKAERNIK